MDAADGACAPAAPRRLAAVLRGGSSAAQPAAYAGPTMQESSVTTAMQRGPSHSSHEVAHAWQVRCLQPTLPAQAPS